MESDDDGIFEFDFERDDAALDGNEFPDEAVDDGQDGFEGNGNDLDDHDGNETDSDDDFRDQPPRKWKRASNDDLQLFKERNPKQQQPRLQWKVVEGWKVEGWKW